MSNSEHYLKQLPTILQEVKAVLTGGLPVSGTDLTDIKTNTADTSANTADTVTGLAIVTACVNQINNHLEVDTNAINGVLTSVNSGLNDTGTQRVCIASDDLNVFAISSNTSATAGSTSTTATNTGVLSNCVWVAQNQVKVDIKTLNDTTIETNAGSLTAGVQRVCIASDDVNLSALYGCIDIANNQVKMNVNSLGGNMTATNQGFLSNGTMRVCIATDDIIMANINTILTDVWDPVAHTLKVSVIP